MPPLSEIGHAIPVILSLILIEGLLSVDNALAIAAMVSHLPKKQRLLATQLGIVGAYFFRCVALVFASWIIDNIYIKTAGALYLIYLMVAHVIFDREEKEHEQHLPSKKKKQGLWMTVVNVELMDLSLSIDNVVAAVAMSSKLWVVITGVFIGIIALRLLAGFCIPLVEKFPILKKTAFLLVGYVGVLLLVEIVTHTEIHSIWEFVGIAAIVACTLLYGKIRSRLKKKKKRHTSS